MSDRDFDWDHPGSSLFIGTRGNSFWVELSLFIYLTRRQTCLKYFCLVLFDCY